MYVVMDGFKLLHRVQLALFQNGFRDDTAVQLSIFLNGKGLFSNGNGLPVYE